MSLIKIDSDKMQEQQIASAVLKRDGLFSSLSWRYERHASELRLGIETTDSMEALDKYAQALRDITTQSGFPINIEWPTLVFSKD